MVSSVDTEARESTEVVAGPMLRRYQSSGCLEEYDDGAEPEDGWGGYPPGGSTDENRGICGSE